jgi:glycosyltransferase involved in cell wall biosynthesis
VQEACGEDSAWQSFCTDAYVAGRYSQFLREQGLFETVIQALLAEGAESGRAGEAQAFLEEMVAHSGQYDDYYEATQPILIYLGPTYCYNILNVFARELAGALERQGERIEFYDTEKEDINGIAALAGKHYKASIGFQTWMMSVKRKDKDAFFCDMIGGPKYNFIVDHPIWLHHQLCDVPKRFYVLTHDRTYQDFIEKYYPKVQGTFLLPPGGRRKLASENVCAIRERCYDITFLGTYGDYRKKLTVIKKCVPSVKFLAAKYLLYMTRHPNLTAETAFRMALEHYGIELGQEDFLNLFGEMKMVIQCVMYYYREKTIAVLLRAGLEIHAYGASWKDSPFYGNPCFMLHEEIQADAAGAVLGKSKISLNIMAWHKDGFTERIADSMLAGAVVVSDASTQLEEDWGEETVLFDLLQIEKLPEKIKALLAQPERMEKIAGRAREKALREATWEVRAAELLKIIESEAL